MPATEDHAAIEIPWGDGGPIPLDVPPRWDVTQVARPDVSGAADDYHSALGLALDAPVSNLPVEAMVGPDSRVAIVVDDPSRWTPIREALPILLARLGAAGLRREDVSISVGAGRHAAVDVASMRKRVGDAIFRSHVCYSPPVDDASKYVELGTTPEGVPVRVFRPVAEADLRILIGSVLPHLQAGFGGGYKLIFPGCSHRSTLGALHRQGLGGDTGALLGGDPDANPMRAAIRSAARLLPGPCFSISHLMGAPGQVFRVVAGDVDAAQRTLAAEATRRFRAPDREAADVVVAGNSPWPGDPMMSFKVLLNHRAACRPGGVLVGFFRTDPEEIDRSFPLGPMKAIARSGAAGGWVVRRGLRLADRVVAALGHPSQFMIRWARELVAERTVLVYSPELRDRLGPRLGPIGLFADQPALWRAAESALSGVVAPKVRVFPQGGLTYSPQAS